MVDESESYCAGFGASTNYLTEAIANLKQSAEHLHTKVISRDQGFTDKRKKILWKAEKQNHR